MDDPNILMEIFVRLLPKQVFRMRCVSKSWNNIISDPIFITSYRRHRSDAGAPPGRLLALFQRTTKHLTGKYVRPSFEPPLNILPVVFPDDRSSITASVPNTNLGYFINASDCLILCGWHPSTYHVLNPMTGRWVSLPCPPPLGCKDYDTSIGLMCEENTSEFVAKYTVVRALIKVAVSDNILPIQTFSSTSSEWVESTLIGTDNFALYNFSEPPSVINGFFHWHSKSSRRSLAIYDPKDGGNHVQLIELPIDASNEPLNSCDTITRSSPDDGDVLWYGRISGRTFKISVLHKGEDGTYKRRTTIPRKEWVLMHHIIIIYIDPFLHVAALPPVSVEAFIQSKPLVVLLRVDKVRLFLYNADTKLGEPVQYHGLPYIYGRHRDFLCPYLESFSLTSYSL